MDINEISQSIERSRTLALEIGRISENFTMGEVIVALTTALTGMIVIASQSQGENPMKLASSTAFHLVENVQTAIEETEKPTDAANSDVDWNAILQNIKPSNLS